MVQVFTDWPVLACMASQYAGWQLSVGKFFAMGSGPMRAAYGKEALFDVIPGREKSTVAPQALALMNGESTVAQAEQFASRIAKQAGGSPEASV